MILTYKLVVDKLLKKTNIIHETVNIDNMSQILIINTRNAEPNVIMLYDPGSEYSIISRSLYEKLSLKPPLLPVNRCGVGINNLKFQFDGVIYGNLQFTRQDNSVYDLQHVFLDYKQNFDLKK